MLPTKEAVCVFKKGGCDLSPYVLRPPHSPTGFFQGYSAYSFLVLDPGIYTTAGHWFGPQARWVLG